jgi:hypothetical protein
MGAKVEGMAELIKKLERLGDFPKEMRKDLRDANRRIGRNAAKAIKNSAMPKGGKEFVVYKKRNKGRDPGPGTIEKKIPKGTLRRSIKVWNAKRSRVNVLVGPKRGGSVSFDGYFAPWVESGNVKATGRSRGSRFYNKIQPSLGRMRPRMEAMQLRLYRKIYASWIKKM